MPKHHHHHPTIHHHLIEPPPPSGCHESDLLHAQTHSLDLVTTLRSELAASAYKRDRLMSELSEAKSSLCAKEIECESLRAQTARNSALICSLQNRLQSTETRERNLQSRNEACSQTLQKEKRCLEEKIKEHCGRIRRMECELTNEETHKEQARNQLQDLVRRLCLCLAIDVCDSTHLTPETVLNKAGEVVVELQRLRTKVTASCEAITNCETELNNVKSISCAEKQRLQTQVETLQSVAKDLENRSRQSEKNLEITRNRLAECEVIGDKLREELRGFESRCCRLQNTIDRFQSDRLQFLRHIASVISVAEPCETLIKDKVRELTNDNQSLQTQVNSLRDQLSHEAVRHRESHESSNCRLRSEEAQRCSIEEKFEKAQHDLQTMRAEHVMLGDFLVRMARALCWSECAEPPTHGTDTTILADSLLERAERLAAHHEHHTHGVSDKNCWDLHHSYHSHNLPKLRRERSCHDIPIKESSAIYSLQRRVRALREQVQRRDLHLELLRRKIALLEDGARGKSLVQGERDEAINRARRSAKQAERTAQHLIEAKAQLAEVKSQLAEAAEYKIISLERARKIDELQSRMIDLENERTKLITQVANYKTRARSAVESSNDRKLQDEHQINHLRDEIARVKTQLTDTNHRLSQLHAFRSSVARILHLRDIPDSDILQRLQTLCNAHQEFTLLSRRYESASPVVFSHEDLIPPAHCRRPLSGSHHGGDIQNHNHHPHHPHHHSHIRRYEDSGFNDDQFIIDDEYEYSKKF